ncbi:MAG: S-methyl-5'-thioadenosine phosphorylase [Pseudomonadota bacterium]
MEEKNMTKIGIIGGSGLYDMDGLEVVEERSVETPFGSPSDKLIFGKYNGIEIVFLARHGRGHVLAPHEINYRANIYAMKSVGVEVIIAVSAVGSMKENIKPGDLVIIDQFIDRTKMRHQTFFENGIVAHVSFADPICETLRQKLLSLAKGLKTKVHDGGSYVCIEGPMFSSRAESNIFRSWGCSVIGMTGYQEARLAREAEICYVAISMSTDYDCWHEGEEDVDVLSVVEVMKNNVEKAKTLIKALLHDMPDLSSCHCRKALEHAIMMDKKLIPDETKQRLKPIIGKYVK